MIDRLDAIARRYHEIESEMARPEVAADHAQITKLAREQRTLRVDERIRYFNGERTAAGARLPKDTLLLRCHPCKYQHKRYSFYKLLPQQTCQIS